QGLMHKVAITPSDEFSDRFPDHMCADLVVTLDDGTRFHASTDDYEGFVTNPLDWAGARRKFDALTSPFAEAELRDETAELLPHHTLSAPCATVDDGTRPHASTDDYEGFATNPLDWAGARRKFDALTSPFAEAELRDEIAELLHDLEHHRVRELTEALARVP